MSTLKINWYLNQIKFGVNQEEAVKNLYQLCSGKSEDIEFIDLGLPSGTLWGSCNLGASKPEAYGNFYQWGDTKPWTLLLDGTLIDNEGNVIDFWGDYDYVKNVNDYKYGQYDESFWGPRFSKYNSLPQYGDVDYRFLLEDSDDAAKQCNSDWRMPSTEEIEELIENTTVISGCDDGFGTYVLQSKINGNTITFASMPYNWGDSTGRVLCCGNELSNGNHSGQARGVSCLAWSDSSSVYEGTGYSYGDFERTGYFQIRPVKNGNTKKPYIVLSNGIPLDSSWSDYKVFTQIMHGIYYNIPIFDAYTYQFITVKGRPQRSDENILALFKAYEFEDYTSEFPVLKDFQATVNGGIGFYTPDN